MTMIKKENTLFKDRDGNTSSKRVAGFALVVLGVVFLLFIGITSIFKTIADPRTALAVGTTIISVGGGLLGVGVLEHLGGPR